MKLERGHNSKIDDRFTIHIAEENDEELNALVNFNIEVHGSALLGTFIRRIFLEHPRKNKILWLYIKDDKKDRFASSICMVPMEWQIGDTTLPVCEMEFVGTLKEYRGKGFIKILNELYENIMSQNGYIMSVIRGIPYYYRSLGYEYVSSLDERLTIPNSAIPNITQDNIKIRKANSNDLSFIKSKYNQYHEKFHIFNKFDSECFKFKYLNDAFNTEVRTTYILEEDSLKANYFSLGKSYDNESYEIVSPDLTQKQMIVLLQFLENLGGYEKDDKIPLSISETSSFYKYIESLSGELFPTYGWQVKIPDLARYFYTIQKLIEDRLEQSEFKGVTKTIRISDYQKSFELNFKNGMLISVNVEKGYPDPKITDLRIPGAFLYKFLLREKTIDELNSIIKDAIIHPSSRSLIETMFPKRRSLFSSYI
jgi:hypothetical protein